MSDLDGLWVLVPIMMGIALVVATGFFGVSVVVSRWASKWALLLLADGKSVLPARVVSLVVLVVTGLPTISWVGAIRAGADAWSILFLVVLQSICFAALMHAAYRDEFIRSAGKNRSLAETLKDVPYAAGRATFILEAARAAGLPTFAGAMRVRALFSVVVVAGAWILLRVLTMPDVPVDPDFQ